MVSNKDIQKEFQIFSDVWSFYKEMLPAHNGQDDVYWQQVREGAERVYSTHPEKLCRDFILVILRDLERKGKEHDCKIAESK